MGTQRGIIIASLKAETAHFLRGCYRETSLGYGEVGSCIRVRHSKGAVWRADASTGAIQAGSLVQALYPAVVKQHFIVENDIERGRRITWHSGPAIKMRSGA